MILTTSEKNLCDMNKATKYYLDNVKKHSDDIILVDYNHQRIIKIIQSGCSPFNKEIQDYLIHYYSTCLNLDFFYEYDINYNLDILIYPLFGYNVLQTIIPTNILYLSTKNILNTFANDVSTSSLGMLKYYNKIIQNIEIYADNLSPFDFFCHKSKFYLLNSNKFYFKMFDKNNKLIHKDQLNQEDQKYIQNYNNKEYNYVIL